MDENLIKKEKKLSEAKLDNDIATQKAEIAQKKRIEHDMRANMGPDWKKVLGIHAKKDTLQDLYAVSPDLRNMSIPTRARR